MKISRRELQKELKDSSLSDIVGVSLASQLTPKQKAFAMEVAKGQVSKAEAYRRAYKKDAKPSSLRNDPYRIASDPRIAREIEAYQVAIEAAKHRTPAALRELVISGLVEIALNPDTKDSVRVQALRTIGTITEVSAFTERKEVRTISSSETAKASILAQLQTLMQGEITDVTSRDAESLLAELNASNVETLPDDQVETLPDGNDAHVETLPDSQAVTDVETLPDNSATDVEKLPDADPTHRGETAGGFGSPTA